jgi:hypothetical protein
MRQLAIVCSLLVVACSSAPASSEQAAVIVTPTAASRAELQAVINKAFNGQSASLADDALTKDSVLLIERQQHRDANGVQLQGRQLGMPERFSLTIVGKQCVLTHERTQQQSVLTQALCKARQ